MAAEGSDEQQCDQCKTSSNDLFQCETCENSNSDETLSVKEHLCEVCVASHIIRGHLITDTKGNQPLICQQHKMLEQVYCRTCDVTFCWRCTSNHSQHKFDTLEKRGLEIKGEISLMLSELENRETFQRDKMERLSKIYERHRAEQLTIRQLVENKIDKLRQSCLTTVGENCDMLGADLEKITQSVDKTTDLQKQLRDLLTSSNAHMLKQITSTQKHVTDNKREHQEFIGKVELLAVTCEMEKITAMFDQFGKEMRIDLKTTIKVHSPPKNIHSHTFQQPREFYLSCPTHEDEFIRVTVKNGLLSIQYAVREWGDPVDRILCFGHPDEMNFENNVERCFVFCYSMNHPKTLMLISATNECFEIDLTKDFRINQITQTSPPYKYLLCPYKPSWKELKIEWAYWDEDAKLIKFTHDHNFTIRCDQLPTVRRSDVYPLDALIFITADNNVIWVDANKKEHWIISVGNRYYGKISCTSVYGVSIIIWFCDDQSVLITRSKSTTPPVKFKWKKESLYDSVRAEGIKYHLMPRIKSSTGEYIYVFRFIFITDSPSCSEDEDW